LKYWNAQLRSHGAVSPCWMEQRHKSASTRSCLATARQAQRDSHNICETRSWFVIAGLYFALVSGVLPLTAQVNVTQEHNHLSRDGLYIDSAFTAANAANLTRDLGFDGTISGNVYAQPLYIESGPNGRWSLR
jgi:hypothetical protein